MSSPFPNPFPQLQIYPESGLSFAWCEWHPGGGLIGSGDAALSPDGVAMSMIMMILWSDLGTAPKELLGYSYVDTTDPDVNVLRRVLPWQHPFAPQLYVKSISSLKGHVLQEVNFAPGPGPPQNVGPGGYTPNMGPWSNFKYASLTLHFWRPPYFVRTDDDILFEDEDGEFVPYEWLRYVDKHWQMNVEMLSREGATFIWAPNQGIVQNNFQGTTGQKIVKTRLSKTWYQIPEAALFLPGPDATPNGIPYNLLYTQTDGVNPITNYTYVAGSPIGGCINLPVNGGTLQDHAPFVLDNDPELRFFGCPMGTLLFLGADITPRPLQLPPALMQIPPIPGNEPLSQVQYDVTFHFELFDPPIVPTSADKGTVSAILVTDLGQGYAGPFAVTLTNAPGDTTGGGAAATATVDDLTGAILSVAVTAGGTKYTIPPIVNFAPGGGTGAQGIAILSGIGPFEEWRGHNLAPNSLNGFWYAVQSQNPVTKELTTPFHYVDMSDLFIVLQPDQIT